MKLNKIRGVIGVIYMIPALLFMLATFWAGYKGASFEVLSLTMILWFLSYIIGLLHIHFTEVWK